MLFPHFLVLAAYSNNTGGFQKMKWILHIFLIQEFFCGGLVWTTCCVRKQHKIKIFYGTDKKNDFFKSDLYSGRICIYFVISGPDHTITKQYKYLIYLHRKICILFSICCSQERNFSFMNSPCLFVLICSDPLTVLVWWMDLTLG